MSEQKEDRQAGRQASNGNLVFVERFRCAMKREKKCKFYVSVVRCPWTVHLS